MKSGPDDAERAASEALIPKEAKPVLMTDMTLDDYEQRVQDTAVEWSASKLIVVGTYESKHGFKSLAEAMAYAKEHMGPGTLIYAIDANGRHVLAGTVPYEAKKTELVEMILKLIEDNESKAKLKNLGWFYGQMQLKLEGKGSSHVINTLLKLYIKRFEEHGVIG